MQIDVERSEEPWGRGVWLLEPGSLGQVTQLLCDLIKWVRGLNEMICGKHLTLNNFSVNVSYNEVYEIFR